MGGFWFGSLRIGRGFGKIWEYLLRVRRFRGGKKRDELKGKGV